MNIPDIKTGRHHSRTTYRTLVNYPTYSPAVTDSLRVGLPVSTTVSDVSDSPPDAVWRTRFPSTTSEAPDDVNRPSPVSTGVNETEALARTSESQGDSEDIPSERPSLRFSNPRDKTLIAALVSLSISNPQGTSVCVRTTVCPI